MGFFLGKSAKFFDRQKLAFIFLNEKKILKETKSSTNLYTKENVLQSHTHNKQFKAVGWSWLFLHSIYLL